MVKAQWFRLHCTVKLDHVEFSLNALFNQSIKHRSLPLRVYHDFSVSLPSPDGRKFRTKAELARFFGVRVDLSNFDFKTGRIHSSYTSSGLNKKSQQQGKIGAALKNGSASLSTVTLQKFLEPPVRQCTCILNQKVRSIETCGPNERKDAKDIARAGERARTSKPKPIQVWPVGPCFPTFSSPILGILCEFQMKRGLGEWIISLVFLFLRQVFWAKRLDGITAVDADSDRKLTPQLPRGFKGPLRIAFSMLFSNFTIYQTNLLHQKCHFTFSLTLIMTKRAIRTKQSPWVETGAFPWRVGGSKLFMRFSVQCAFCPCGLLLSNEKNLWQKILPTQGQIRVETGAFPWRVGGGKLFIRFSVQCAFAHAACYQAMRKIFGKKSYPHKAKSELKQ